MVFLRFTGRWSTLSPSRPRPFRFVNDALVPSDNFALAASAAGFRLRFGSGVACASASFRYALLSAFRSSFSLVDPQTEASIELSTRQASEFRLMFQQFPRAPTDSR